VKKKKAKLVQSAANTPDEQLIAAKYEYKLAVFSEFRSEWEAALGYVCKIHSCYAKLT